MWAWDSVSRPNAALRIKYFLHIPKTQQNRLFHQSHAALDFCISRLFFFSFLSKALI